MIDRFTREFGKPDIEHSHSPDQHEARWNIRRGVTLTVSNYWGVSTVVIALTDNDTDDMGVSIDGINVQSVMRGDSDVRAY